MEPDPVADPGLPTIIQGGRSPSIATKGGDPADTDGRRCVCNGLVATIGLGQRRADGYLEPALLTLGQDLGFLPELVVRAGPDYRAGDVVDYLLHG